MGLKIKPAAAPKVKAVKKAAKTKAATMKAPVLTTTPKTVDPVDVIEGLSAEDSHTLLELADAGLVLEKELKALKAKTATLNKAREKIRAKAQEMLELNNIPRSTKIEAGPMEVQAEREMKAITDKTGLYNLFEKKQPGLFFELCNIGIGDVEKHMGSETGCVAAELSGKRLIRFPGA